MAEILTSLDAEDKCPVCGCVLTREEVDIGVGTMYGPARCDNCGWSQEGKADKLLKELLSEGHEEDDRPIQQN